MTMTIAIAYKPTKIATIMSHMWHGGVLVPNSPAGCPLTRRPPGAMDA
jgi:hypothetical protein